MHFRYLILIVLLASIWPPATAAEASPDCRPRPEVCVYPTFREFWQQNGGLDQFGFSITDWYPLTVNNRTTYIQEFERARFEFNPRVSAPHNIVLGRVGAEWLDYHIDELTPLLATDEPFAPGIGRCAVVEPNTPAVCGAFLDYHTTHGAEIDGIPLTSRNERLRLFGLPLTSAMRWSTNGQSIVVQVFERARFEYHPNDPAGKTVQMGMIQAENTLQGVPKPQNPSPAVNYLVDTGTQILPNDVLDTFRTNMPFNGFWQTSTQGMTFAVSTFRYTDSFYSIPAPVNHKWVTFTVLIKNNREYGQPAVYVDYTYITILDLEGNRHVVAPHVEKLDLPFPPSTIEPQTHVVGQMLMAIPIDTGIAQIEFNGANMDQYISRFSHMLELRVAPQN
jgi:hypothetical protein